MEFEERKLIHENVVWFAECVSGLKLRAYQEEIARVIVDSILSQSGRTFVVQLPRQSGKNEVQAQIETYLLSLYQSMPAEIVKVSPTFKPQTLNAMRRLERVLANNRLTGKRWKKESGYIYRLGKARITFLSGSPGANVVGATASTLLECDEAQDVLVAKWDKEFNPMAASTNATRVFWGTAWTSRTLLAREKRAALEAEKEDGKRRVFVLSAEDVAREAPEYGVFVAGEIEKLGRGHPLVKTQYFGEEIDAETGMFPERRMALMRGDHSRQSEPEAGKIYAICIDLAGEDEAAQSYDDLEAGLLANPRRDSTALTVFEVDCSTLGDELVQAPTYRVVDRKGWTGTRHTRLYGRLKAMIEHWKARYVVVDSTGVGAGLASFLTRAYGEKVVIGFTFNGATKSKLGWDFLGVVETGRFKDWRGERGARDERSAPKEQAEFEAQLRETQMEVLPGPERRMKWGVPDGTRDAQTGELVHDDWVLSAALVAVLDRMEWTAGGPALLVQRPDPLQAIDRGGF